MHTAATLALIIHPTPTPAMTHREYRATLARRQYRAARTARTMGARAFLRVVNRAA